METIRPGFRSNDAVKKVAKTVERCIAEVSALPAFYVPMVMGTSHAGVAAVLADVAVEKAQVPGARTITILESILRSCPLRRRWTNVFTD